MARPRLGNPLSWRMADRCFAIALILVVANGAVIVATAAGGWPFLPPGATEAPGLVAVELSALGAWAALAVASRLARGRARAGYALAGATVVLYTATLAAFTLGTGPFAAPGWIAYLGGSVVGYVLFPRWMSLAGIVAYAALVIGGAAAVTEGWLDAASFRPLVAAWPHEGGVARSAAASLALFALTFAVIAFVVDRWRAREAEYARLASTDPLTGLTNRRRFLELASRELARSRRYASPVALVLVDLDHFKLINDRHGHAVGDQALALAATVLSSAVRDVDVIARHGGEEFAILLPMTDAAGAAEVAERCRRRLAEATLVTADAEPVRVTASFGVAADGAGGDLDDLLRRADAALYRAKAAGRDRVELA